MLAGKLTRDLAHRDRKLGDLDHRDQPVENRGGVNLVQDTPARAGGGTSPVPLTPQRYCCSAAQITKIDPRLPQPQSEWSTSG